MVKRYVVLGIALLLVVLGVAPAGANHGVSGTVCLVADPGGFGDGGFNSAALTGAERAARKLHVELVTADPGSEVGIADVVEGWASSEACDLIIGVGFIGGLAMEPLLSTYDEQRFAVIDYVFSADPENAASVIFQSDQPAFLAGYVAAAVSETGKVGTYGGMRFPSVTDFMNGYALGVEYYNSEYGADVEVLGWDLGLQDGLFSWTFTDPSVGKAIAEALFDQGADTVFPVAGATGAGTVDAAAEAKAAGDVVRVVYPDFDAYESLGGDPARVFLTSAEKLVDNAAYHQIQKLVDGTWTGGIVVEDLASGGVDIAPFHKTNNQVPGFVRNDLREIRTGIIDGTIPTLP